VAAVASCARCRKALCEVCRFTFGGRPFCSDCATAGPTADERSRVFRGGLTSVVLAVAGFAVLAAIMVGGASGGVSQGMAQLLGIPMIACPLAGVATALVAREGARRTRSLLPAVGLVASGILLAIVLVLILVGNSR
jgi:hypothetical protein